MPRPLSVTLEKAVRLERDIDESGVAGNRLVHGIVEDFGEEMMQGCLIRPADIHAGPAPDRFEPFEDFDRSGGIGGFARRAGRGHAQTFRRPRALCRRRRGRARCMSEQILGFRHSIASSKLIRS